MRGACPLTSVGAGYVITDPAEPHITIKQTLGHYHVCIRRSEIWKEIIADVAEYHIAVILVAQLIAQQIQKEGPRYE